MAIGRDPPSSPWITRCFLHFPSLISVNSYIPLYFNSVSSILFWTEIYSVNHFTPSVSFCPSHSLSPSLTHLIFHTLFIFHLHSFIPSICSIIFLYLSFLTPIYEAKHFAPFLSITLSLLSDIQHPSTPPLFFFSLNKIHLWTRLSECFINCNHLMLNVLQCSGGETFQRRS